jgi:hypothetical protein
VNAADLLPGTLGPDATQPDASFHPHQVVRQARRQATIRNVIDGTTLLLIDALIFFWPAARLPFTQRETTVALVALLNAVFLAVWLVRRKLPEWKARRIASTWCEDEREKTFGGRNARRARGGGPAAQK